MNMQDKHIHKDHRWEEMTKLYGLYHIWVWVCICKTSTANHGCILTKANNQQYHQWSHNSLWPSKTTELYSIASTSGSDSAGTEVLFPPRRRADTLSIAAFSWLNLELRVCRVFCSRSNRNEYFRFLDMKIYASSKYV